MASDALKYRPPDEKLVAMAGILVSEQSPDKTLRQILELACAAMPGGDEGGITLLDREGPSTAMSTSAVALRLDSTQYTAATGGPCVDAYRRQQVLRISATSRDQRWPEFSRTAAAAGLNSTLSIPLIVGGDGLGTLNLYCHDEDGFPAGDDRMAATLGSAASVALANSRTFWKAARLTDQLEQALSSRGSVERATGILMARHDCTPEYALHLLASTAQHNRLTVTDVADDLIERTGHPQPSASA
ncbi:MAG TPA: GAF and ANTAR domain-containing protein [Streptosporangiaceae bacterium]